MGIGSITAASGMSSMQITSTDLKDQKSKSIQNEITDVQQQMQKLSATQDLPANEKANERKKLQQEEASLNTKLKQHQDELLRSHRREIMMAELLEEKKPAEEKETEDAIRSKETASETGNPKDQPTDGQQAAQPGTVITRNRDGIVLLKEVPDQNKNPDTDAESKQTEGTKEEVAVEQTTEAVGSSTATDDDSSAKEMHAMVSADSFLQQADHQGTVISRSRDGIAILKSEIKLDEGRGGDTERKQAQLAKIEKQNQREMEFQFSLLGEANDSMKSAAETNNSTKGKPQANTENIFHVSGLQTSQEEQMSQPKFYVSIA